MSGENWRRRGVSLAHETSPVNYVAYPIDNSLCPGDAYRQALEEHNEFAHQLTLKNLHLKKIIDQMRNIIWEINTMLAMRRNP